MSAVYTAKKPDATQYNPSPDHFRALVAATGMTQRAIAARIGISDRALRYWTSDAADDKRKPPYTVQFTLECLARKNHASE